MCIPTLRVNIDPRLPGRYSPTMMFARVAAMALFCLAGTAGVSAQKRPLPPIPGQDDPHPTPVPGSTFVGENPRNAIYVDLGVMAEALLAGGVGVGVGYDRGVATMVALAAHAGWVHVEDSASDYSIDIVSVLGGARLFLLDTAVNGPCLSLLAGIAAVRLRWGAQILGFTWPQLQAELGARFSFGPGARGGCLQPYLGYKLALLGAGTDGLPIPRYGGFQFGLRGGLSF